eukprot:3395871-Alexandrium_andersonii.AAC.1
MASCWGGLVTRIACSGLRVGAVIRVPAIRFLGRWLVRLLCVTHGRTLCFTSLAISPVSGHCSCLFTGRAWGGPCGIAVAR